ncbi:hypothetical protein L4C33_10760 [Vibrio makurazakiensis]|uniref:hypothetical protein n=1 Tax=Vibrio makurazakiensis TaxID=2910250 RepID=UPI003D0C45DD
MTSLEACLIEAGINDTSLICQNYSDEYQGFLKNNHVFFKNACANKPEHSERQILLGLLTKLHIENTTSFESASEDSIAMQNVISDAVGKEHLSKFKYTQSESLSFVTHLWLYIQGRLGMDFSLANDHAHATSELISRNQALNIDVQRTQFLESYYAGFKVFESGRRQSNSLFSTLKKLLNRF